MRAILAASLVFLLVPGPSPFAQQAENREAAAPSQSTSDGTADGDETAAKPSPPPLTEAEQKAQDKRIMVLQERVDTCHTTFMGLPFEHEECINKVLLITNDPASADEAGIGDSNHE